MGGRYLYCQNPDCGVYLGSLGANLCSLCGWRCGDHDDAFGPRETLRQYIEQQAEDAELLDWQKAVADEFRAAIPTQDGRILAAMIEHGVTALESHIRAAIAQERKA